MIEPTRAPRRLTAACSGRAMSGAFMIQWPWRAADAERWVSILSALLFDFQRRGVERERLISTNTVLGVAGFGF